MQKPTKKKTLGGYPATGVIVSITLTLLVIGIFGVIAMYTNQFERVVRENINLKVYIKSQLSETQLKQIEQTLAAQKFVATLDSAIIFTSREETKKIMDEAIGSYDDLLGDNPYKDMFTVSINPSYHTTQQLDSIKKEMENINGVIDVLFEKESLEQINTNFAKISLVLFVITAVLLVTVVMLINNTLRIALFSQRFLIRSMQLVGAKNSFIQRPFLWRAMAYGLMSGVFASFLLWLSTHYLYQWFGELILVHNEQIFYIIMGVLTIFGITIALLSTYISIKRYLRMSLDELY